MIEFNLGKMQNMLLLLDLVTAFIRLTSGVSFNAGPPPAHRRPTAGSAALELNHQKPVSRLWADCRRFSFPGFWNLL